MKKGDLLDCLLHLLGGEAPREPVCGGEPLALQLAHQLLLRFDLIKRKNILKGENIRFLQTTECKPCSSGSLKCLQIVQLRHLHRIHSTAELEQSETIAFNGMYSSL
jgi:hypothetical protein